MSILAPLVLAALAAGLAPADDLDRSLVPADTPILIHVDVAGLCGSTLLKAALEIAGTDLEEELDFGELERELGIDPREDIRSVTVFGTGAGFGSGSGLDGGAAVVRTSERVDAVLEKLRAAGKLREGRLSGATVYGLEDGLAYVHPGANAGERLVVLSEDEGSLLRAMQVLRGEAPSLAQARSTRLIARPRSGAFLFVEVSDVLGELAGEFGGPASRLGELARRFALQVGEERGRFFLEAELETADAEGARSVVDIANGLKALAALATEEVPPFALELLSTIRLEAAGERVHLSFEYDSRALVEELHALDED